MNYAYDIILNFQKEYYDFFEWNSNDETINIKKIPLFRIPNNDYKLFKYGIIKINKNFMYEIFKKSEKLKKKKTTNLNYIFLISNTKEAIAVKLNKNGINTYKSSLLIEEEDDVCNIASTLNISKIEYKIISNSITYNYQTRKQKEINKIVNEKLKKLYKNGEKDKLKYLYLECFNKLEININKIYCILKNEIKNHTKNENIIYNFFKTIESKEKG